MDGGAISEYCSALLRWEIVCLQERMDSHFGHFLVARCKGLEEGEVTSQLFGRLSLTLMRANAMMLSTRRQDADFPLPEVDGVE